MILNDYYLSGDVRLGRQNRVDGNLVCYQQTVILTKVGKLETLHHVVKYASGNEQKPRFVATRWGRYL